MHLNRNLFLTIRYNLNSFHFTDLLWDMIDSILIFNVMKEHVSGTMTLKELCLNLQIVKQTSSFIFIALNGFRGLTI